MTGEEKKGKILDSDNGIFSKQRASSLHARKTTFSVQSAKTYPGGDLKSVHNPDVMRIRIR